MKKISKYQNIHESLLFECSQGNQKSQFEIYKLYYKAMFNASLRIINNTEDAEDIMQEAFLKAFNNLDKYKGEVSFGAWLKRIVVYKSLDYLRKRKIEFIPIDEGSDIVTEEDPGQGTDENEKISYELLIEEINKLAEGYRIILTLYLIENYSHSEIAEMLKISSSTSRSQFNRAKKRLLENIKKINISRI